MKFNLSSEGVRNSFHLNLKINWMIQSILSMAIWLCKNSSLSFFNIGFNMQRQKLRLSREYQIEQKLEVKKLIKIASQEIEK